MTDPSIFFDRALDYWHQQDVAVIRLITITVTVSSGWLLTNYLINVEDGNTRKMLMLLRSAYPFIALAMYIALIAALWSHL